MNRDTAKYEALLKSIALISGLFSENSAPYIDSRFVEKMFALTTGAIDLGRKDCSFDMKIEPDIGIGVKTFLGGAGSHKTEKIAELTSLSRRHEFDTEDKLDLAILVSNYRNIRVQSDALENGIDLKSSIYHCLIRFPKAAIVHEEPYHLIDLDAIQIIKRNDARNDTDLKENILFSDGKSVYSYSRSKNVLFKRFTYEPFKNRIPLEVSSKPFDLLFRVSNLQTNSELSIAVELDNAGRSHQMSQLKKGIDYVILPLYSPKSHSVQLRSGINQWNAGGRSRKYGEAYIPVPVSIHHNFPGFFPERDQKFKVRLSNQTSVFNAKICQAGGKALMTSPNFELGKWLTSVIDPTIPNEAFNRPVGGRAPFTYLDLEKIGKDSVAITKSIENGESVYLITFSPIGSYEDFIDFDSE
jgi:hypothetical protein